MKPELFSLLLGEQPPGSINLLALGNNSLSSLVFQCANSIKVGCWINRKPLATRRAATTTTGTASPIKAASINTTKRRRKIVRSLFCVSLLYGSLLHVKLLIPKANALKHCGPSDVPISALCKSTKGGGLPHQPQGRLIITSTRKNYSHFYPPKISSSSSKRLNRRLLAPPKAPPGLNSKPL